MNDAWVYQDVETKLWVYRASSLGSCIRSLTAARLGESAFPFHATVRAAMDASSGLEEECIRRFCIEVASSDVIWQQKKVELRIPLRDTFLTKVGESTLVEHNDNPIVRGHIDGLYQLDDSIIEVKCLGPTNFNRYNSGGLDALGSLGQKYKMQAAVYGYATERKVRFVIGEKVRQTMLDPEGVERNVLIGDGQQIWKLGDLIIEPPVDPSSLVLLSEIHDRIRTIEDHASRDELPDCDRNCREGDPYSEVHFFASPSIGTDTDLEKVVRYDELRELLGSEGERDGSKRYGLLGEYADLKDYFKEQYGDPNFREKRSATMGPFTVTVVSNRGRESIDAHWLRKNHPDIAISATKIGSPYHQLIVKRQKGQEG